VPVQRRQVAALVHRSGNSGPEILLITSRDTGRWIIPKGWRQKGRSRARSALREAFEEAGIRGSVRKKAIGSYVYEKRIDKKGVTHDCLVDVFLVAFSKQEKKWPERGQRTSAWLKPSLAARKVAEIELKAILRSCCSVVKTDGIK
jgi:8-oxo-dGTP pyrophosphatase MutT (NUDIX family)